MTAGSVPASYAVGVVAKTRTTSLPSATAADTATSSRPEPESLSGPGAYKSSEPMVSAAWNSASHSVVSMPHELLTTCGAFAASPPGARNHSKIEWNADAVAFAASSQPLAAIHFALGATPML